MTGSTDQALRQHKEFNRRLRILLTVSIAAILVGAFFWLESQGTDSWVLLGIALVPNLLTALVAWLAVEVVLAKTGPSVADEVSRSIAELMSEAQTPQIQEFTGDVAGFQGSVDRLIRERLEAGSESVRVTVVGYTGLTFFTSLLKGLCHSYGKRLQVQVHIIDFAAVDSTRLDKSWPTEAAEAVKLLAASAGYFNELEVQGLPTVPSILGVKVEESDLFFTFPYWLAQSGQPAMLRQGNLAYRYVSRTSKDSPLSFVFEVFDNWASSPGQRDLLAAK